MNKGKIYSINSTNRYFNTNQKTIVIPTGEMIKNKGADMRLLSCISAISNVANYHQEGDNYRYCSIKKINSNLSTISDVLDIDRVSITRKIRSMANLNSKEFNLSSSEYLGVKETCIDINYNGGHFVTLDYGLWEFIVENLSEKAFRLYINLLWLCRDTERNIYVERQIKQEYLLESIGLSKNSKTTIRKLENELINLNLIEVKVRREIELSDDLSHTTPKTKKYYKIL